MKTKFLQPPYVGVEWGGGAGRYSPGAPSALTQIVHYSSSYYTVFHSVIYNSVLVLYFINVFNNPVPGIPPPKGWREDASCPPLLSADAEAVSSKSADLIPAF